MKIASCKMCLRFRRWAAVLLIVLPGALLSDERSLDDKEEQPPYGSQTIRRDEIKKELAGLKNHAWAGEYFRGDGFAENIRSTLAPDSGFAINVTGCGFIGWLETDYGAVNFAKGRVKLCSELKQSNARHRSTEMLQVRWGKRSYLVAADEMPDFCNRVNSGREPRNDFLGGCFLRDDDWKRKATGSPDLPKEFRRYLLKRPISTEIIMIHSSKIDAAGARRTTATISAGAKHGVFPALELYVVELEVILVTAEVTSVGEDTAIAVVYEYPIGKRIPVPGWKLTTRAPYH